MSLNKRLMSSEAAALVPSENFNTVIYTGNSNDQSITGVGFQPDFVWIKERSEAENHNQIDSTRGTGKILSSNLAGAEFASGRFTSFDTDGFTLSNNNESNDDGVTYVAYCWKANGGTTSSNSDGSGTSTVQVNTDAGFSIAKMTFAGEGSIGHGLGVAPDLVILKGMDAAEDWQVYHSAVGTGKYLKLNTTGAVATRADSFSTVNSTIVTNDWTGSSVEWIMYSFVSIDGYSKFGSYTGNGDAFGPIIETGFEVGWLLIRRTDSGDNWLVFDNKRHEALNNNLGLIPNSTAAESVGNLGNGFTFLSNGFHVVSSDSGVNASSGEYIYMAFATDPDTTAPTLADSFGIKAYTGDYASTNALTGLGFSPNLVWIKNRPQADSWRIFDTIRGATNYLASDGTGAETTNANTLKSFDADGFTVGSDGTVNATVAYISYAWKADDNEPTINDNGSIDSITSVNANAGFSIVKYTGNDVSGATVGHGLSAKPDFILIKNLSITKSWMAWHGSLSGELGYLDNNDAFASSRYAWAFDSTQPTSSLVTFNNNSNSNDSHTNAANDYIMYCWHSVTGYSKFGTYDGTGGSFTVTTGFQPDFVMIKRTDSTGSFVIIDSERASGGSRLYADLNNAEDTGQGETFSSTGFSPRTSTTNDTNTSGGTYVYAAFKIN